jgi:arylsulfatase A-like enzyme
MWPGRIPAGSVSDLPSAFWDFLPTFAELTGQYLPGHTDGVSLLPTLLDHGGTQTDREYLYWEFQGRQAVRLGQWKAYRMASDGDFELYDLDADRSETSNVAAEYPEVVSRIEAIMVEARTESELFPLIGG